MQSIFRRYISTDRNMKLNESVPEKLNYHDFSLRAIKRHWSLIPLVAIIGGGVGMAASYIVYMAVTKQDFSLRPWKFDTDAPYTTNPHEIRKLYNIHKPRVDLDPEIEALKREIGSYGTQK